MQEESVQQPQHKSLEELLAEAQAKIEQQRDSMLRAVADAENARKRAQTEAASAQKYALERFAERLLPVMDSLEAALKSGDTSGVELTLKQLTDALEKSSIRPIEPKAGERFDPHRHQAMAAVEADSEPNTVVSVMQKGYGLHDRVLRPALVTVAKAKVENGGGNPTSNTDLDS
jgi:molecular chaperone GrpE